MWVTCYTDASFRRGSGRWAVWIRSDRGRIVKAGACPDYVNEPGSAELAAIYAAIYLAIAAWGDDVSVVLIRSDCLNAQDWLEGRARARRKDARRLIALTKALLRKHDVELRCRWVRGHQPRERSTEAYLNDACDRLAAEGWARGRADGRQGERRRAARRRRRARRRSRGGSG